MWGNDFFYCKMRYIDVFKPTPLDFITEYLLGSPIRYPGDLSEALCCHPIPFGT